MKPQVVFVDNERSVLALFRRMLQAQESEWRMQFFADALEAWQFLERHPVDAVVLDVSMPHLSGIEMLRRIRRQERTRHVPVAILTGMGDAGLKREVLDLGATDLLCKPFFALDLIARLRSMLRLKAAEDELRRRNVDLESAIRERTRQLRHSRMQIIWRLGKAAEFRDEQTGEHVVRVGCYAYVLAEALGLPSPFRDEIILAAPLHDVGKIGISDTILLKAGDLSAEERAVMRTHCEIGERILQEPSLLELCIGVGDGADSPLGNETDPVMRLARQIALNHHECWNGTGYPRGIGGTEIPLGARIVAVADAYDAILSERPYKAATNAKTAARLIEAASGTQFDPQVVEAFLACGPRLETVRNRVARAMRSMSTGRLADEIEYRPHGRRATIDRDSSSGGIIDAILSEIARGDETCDRSEVEAGGRHGR